MSSLDDFISRFGTVTESYWFYNNTEELCYDPKAHAYFKVTPAGMKRLAGVTETCHIIDKSEALVPWGCKMMAAKLLKTLPRQETPEGICIPKMPFADIEQVILAAKSAHTEHLEDASEVGQMAHTWIELYIKSVLANDEPRKLELLSKFPLEERARNGCIAALDWMNHHNVRWIGTERKVYSRTYGYAGTMDGLCMADSCQDRRCCPTPFKNRLSVADWKTSNSLHMEYLMQTAAYQQAWEEEFSIRISDRWVIRLGKEDAEFEAWHAEEEDFEADLRAFLTAQGLGKLVKQIKDRVQARKTANRESLKAERRAAKDAAVAAEKERKALAKLAKKADKAAALLVKCKGADKYKGKMKPRCNKGNPCQTCLTKYAETQ